MKIRTIKTEIISDLIAEACLQINFELRPDVKMLLERAAAAETLPAPKRALEQLTANYKIAAAEKMPLCQDCGYITVFIELGQEVVFQGDLDNAVQKGVKRAYQDHGLRQSVIADAWSARTDFKPERPAAVYVDLKPGKQVRLTVMAKGGGSDNASRLWMLRPTADRADLIAKVVQAVIDKGSGACPPLFIGVGIGGGFDQAPLLAKKALLRRFDNENLEPETAALEREILTAVNELHLGAAGLGGAHTALGVSVVTAPCHMACLPLAVNLGCNSLRSKEIIL